MAVFPRLGRALSVSTLLLLSVATHAQATPPVIYACIAANGSVRIVGAAGACKNNETPVQWNAAGPEGPAGPQGPAGPEGPAGVQGPQGAQGTSGVIDVLHQYFAFGVSQALTSLPNSPEQCRTLTYVAGPGEVAILSIDVSTTSGDPAATLIAQPMMVANSAPSLSSRLSTTPFSDNGGFVHTQDVVPLQAGTSYRFGVAVKTSGLLVSTPLTCNVLVTVAKTP